MKGEREREKKNSLIIMKHKMKHEEIPDKINNKPNEINEWKWKRKLNRPVSTESRKI